MGIYEKLFTNLLEKEEVENLSTPKITSEAENQALQAELDAETSPESFNTDGGQVEIIRKESLAKQKQILADWISEVERFLLYVNGVNSKSIQGQLHNAGCDTLFEKIASSEHRRISRIAVELSGLEEALKGYLIAGTQD